MDTKAPGDLRRGDLFMYRPNASDEWVARVLATRPGCISELMPEELLPWATRRAVVVVELFLARPIMVPGTKWPSNYWRAWLRPGERVELCNRRNAR